MWQFKVAWPHWAVRFRSWCMNGLRATVGVAGEAGPDCEAGHETTSGAEDDIPRMIAGVSGASAHGTDQDH